MEQVLFIYPLNSSAKFDSFVRKQISTSCILEPSILIAEPTGEYSMDAGFCKPAFYAWSCTEKLLLDLYGMHYQLEKQSVAKL